MGLFGKLFKGSEDPYDKYTYDWLKKSPEEELDEEREKIRLRHCSGDERAMHYLDVIDREKNRRYKPHILTASRISRTQGARLVSSQR